MKVLKKIIALSLCAIVLAIGVTDSSGLFYGALENTEYARYTSNADKVNNDVYDSETLLTDKEAVALIEKHLGKEAADRAKNRIEVGTVGETRYSKAVTKNPETIIGEDMLFNRQILWAHMEDSMLPKIQLIPILLCGLA